MIACSLNAALVSVIRSLLGGSQKLQTSTACCWLTWIWPNIPQSESIGSIIRVHYLRATIPPILSALIAWRPGGSEVT